MSLRNFGENGFTYYWKIKHYSLRSLLENDIIESPGVRVEELDNTEWNLHLDPHRESDISLDIRRLNFKKDPNYIFDVKLFLLKANGERVEKESKNESFDIRGYSEKPLIHKRSEIFENKTLFLPCDTLTVGCFVKKHAVNISASAVCTACTGISTETLSCAFPFRFSQQQQIITLSTPSESTKYPNFKIVLESLGSNNDSGLMAVKMVMEETDCDILCKCKLSVEDTKRKTVFLFEGCHKYEDEEPWNLTNSVTSIEKIPDTSKDTSFLLRCVLVLSDDDSSYTEDIAYSVSAFKQKSLPELSLKEKLDCLRTDDRLCDFTLRVDGEEFRIHKAVLGAVSPYFCAMFELEMKERETSSSTIKDVDADTMRKLIDFAYIERLENLDWESAVKLYIAASRFQIPELRQNCGNYLISNLTVEKVSEVFVISDLYEDADLEEESGNFMCVHAEEVFKSASWNTFAESNETVSRKITEKTFTRLICKLLSFWKCLKSNNFSIVDSLMYSSFSEHFRQQKRLILFAWNISF